MLCYYFCKKRVFNIFFKFRTFFIFYWPNFLILLNLLNCCNQNCKQDQRQWLSLQHPDYDVITGLPNDIAIMTLANPITTSTAANAVFPPDDNNLYIQSNCYLAGWGHTGKYSLGQSINQSTNQFDVQLSCALFNEHCSLKGSLAHLLTQVLRLLASGCAVSG